jgi:hypothetical protein
MQKKTLTNYDQTKRMLNTLRRLNESKININKILREDDGDEAKGVDVFKDDEETKSGDDITVINDVDVKIVSSDFKDLEISEEDKNSISQLIDGFKSQVSNLSEFDPGFTISKDQIRLDGTLTDDDISFVFIAGEDNGIYLNADMLEIKTEVIDLISKLNKFNDTFSTTMNKIIDNRKNN